MAAFKNNGKLKLLIIVGTRPEIIRLSAVINKCREYFDVILAHTGQNYDYNLNGVFFRDLKLAVETKRNGYGKWWSMLIIAAVSLVFGVLCIVNAFGMVKLALQFIGIALIYDGISDLWVANRAVHAAKMMKQEAEAVDVDYKEI